MIHAAALATICSGHPGPSSDLHVDATLRDQWNEVDGGWHFELPAGWGQGRSVFGGLVGAVAASLARLHVGDGRSLRTMSTQLLRPTRPGRLDGTVSVLREGKYTSFVEVILSQDGARVVTANFVFARHRGGAVTVDATVPWTGPDPETLADVPYVPGAMPECVRNVTLRWGSGPAPFSGADEASFVGFCRTHYPSGDIEGVLAILDIFPPPSLVLLNTPAPASTVSWTAHVLDAPERLEGWLRVEYRTVVGAGGMHTTVARLFDPDGRLLGWSEQLVAVFG